MMRTNTILTTRPFMLFLQAMVTLRGMAEHRAAVSCSAVLAMLGGVGLGSGTTGRLGRAWVGAWVVHG